MVKTTAKINGMACCNCEAHVTEAICKAFPGAKATASHTENTAVILTEVPLDPAALKAAVDAAGYVFLSAESAPC